MKKKSVENDLLESGRHSTDTPADSLEKIDDELFGDLEIQRTTKSTANLDVIKLPPMKTTLSRGIPAPIISTQAVKEPKSSKIGLFVGLGLLLLGGSVGAYFLFLRPPSDPATTLPVVVSSDRQAIEIASQPPGASVWIDDKRYQDPTPLQVRLLVGKVHKIRLEKIGYKAAIQALTPGKQAAVFRLAIPLLVDAAAPSAGADGGSSAPDAPAALPPLLPPADPETLGTLAPDCQPLDAEIRLKGRLFGSCKQKTLSLPEGDYDLTFRKPGYTAQTTKVKITKKEETKISIRLARRIGPPRLPTPPGGIEVSIESSPSAQVYWRDKKLGKTPLKHRFPSGKHKLTFKVPSLYTSKDKEFVAKPGQTDAVKVTFGKGQIRFFIKPWADVFLNGKKIGQTPLPPHSTWQGVYRVELKMKDKTFQKLINLKEGDNLKIEHSF